MASSSFEFRQGLVEIGDEAVVGDLEDRRLLVLVDRDDDLRVLHAGQVLDRARDADRDVELRGDHLAGLADLPVVRRIARVDRRARGAHRRAELVGHRLDVGLEVLGLLHRPAAGDDDLGGGELRPVGLGERVADERRHARIARRGDRFDRRRAAGGGRAERGRAHGRDDLRIGRFDGLDRVAGVDRPLEGFGAHDLDDVGDLHHVEERRDPRQHVLGARGRRRDDRVVGGAERHDQRRERLGEPVRVGRGVGDENLADARKLRGRLGGRRDAPPGDEHVDRLRDLEGRRQRPRGQVAQAPARDFRKKKGRHGQITPASSWSFATSSETVFTLTPALRPEGSDVLSTLRRGATSTP